MKSYDAINERERERERELDAPSKSQPPTLRRYAFSALLIVALLLVGFGISYAATFTAGGNGNWNIGTTWGKACASSCTQGTDYPGQNDLANISSNTVTLTTNQSVGSTTLSGTGVLNLGSYILSVYNNWTSTSTGTFNANTGTVNFAGTNQYIFGTTTFNNLTKTVSSADSLSFPMSTTTVTGSLTLGGATGTPLTLQGFEATYVSSNIGTSSLANGVLNGYTTNTNSDGGTSFIALDSSGNIYVVDTNGNRIEKFDTSGNFVSKFGVYGSGNGQLNTPYGIAIDSSNNIYVVDSGNKRVQEFDSSGNYLSQFGSSGTGAGQFTTPRGIGIATSTGDIYVVDSGNNRIQRFNSSGTFTSTYGWGVATGASSTEICTSSCRAGFAVASTTAGGFNRPYGIAVNSWGNVIYVTDYTNNRIVSSDLTGNYLSKWGTSGSGNGSTTNPYGIAINKNGDIYLADLGNLRVEIFASTTNAYVSKFTSVAYRGIAVDSSGNIFVSSGNLIAKYNSAFTKQFQSGLSQNGNGTIYAPSYLVTDSSGNLYVSDSGNDRVLKFDTSGNYSMKFGSAGVGDGQFGYFPSYGPRGIAIDGSGNILVADPGGSRVEVFNSSGTFVTKFATTSIYDIAVDSSGNVYTLDKGTCKASKFNSSYNLLLRWGSAGTGDGQFASACSSFFGIAVDPTGQYVYVSDGGNNRIEKFDSSGNFLAKWGSLGSGYGQFNAPGKVFVDSAGLVYVVDTGNNRIEKFDSNGNYLAQWGSYGTGSGQFSGPIGVTVDSSGNVYVADYYNSRIQKFHNLWQISATGSTSISYATVKDSSNYGTAIKCFNCTDSGNNVGWSFITATAPTMAVATSSNVASTSVTLNSGITSDGNASSTIIGFNYGTSISYGSATSTTGTYGNGYFSMNVTGLPCGGTVYHYQSFATNAVGTGTSSDATFTTGSCTSTIYPPTLATATSSSVTYTTATLSDNIATDGGSASTIAGFNYGTSTSYGSVASTTGTYSAGNQWNIGVTGLTCSTAYHFQGYATNSGGTGTSSDQTFTTATCPLSITSFSPSGDQPTWTYYTTLSFTTNEAATCKYATTSDTTYAAISMTADTSSTTHSWPITAISSGHSYTYYPFCRDAALYENPVTPIAFNIPTDSVAPDLVDVSPTFIYFDTAIIQWNTTEPSDTLFEYGTSASLGTTIPLDKSLSIPHAITLTNLTPGTTYYYQVTDKDKSGNSTSSPIQSFTTLSQSYAQQYYIATAANGGSDSNDGTIAHPFLTLEKAQTSTRTWRTANPSCSTPVMVWLRGGEYYRTSYFYLGSSDSGSTNCPTIFSSYGNENAVITGSKDISGFTKITNADPLYSRLNASAQANVYAISLPAQGINDYGDLRSVFNGSQSPLELMWNGKVMSLPRYPNAGDTNFPYDFKITSYTTSGSDPVLGYGNYAEPANWASSNDIWAHGVFHYEWRDWHQRVKSFDLVNKTVTLDSATTTSTNTGAPTANSNVGYAVFDANVAGYFYFENVFEELNTPGEYYIDRSTGTLYFWPPSDISQGRAQVSMNKTYFVNMYGVSNIMFQNLTFENTRGTAIFGKAQNSAIVHSIIHNTGGSGIIFSGDNTISKTGVYNSHIYDTGSAGIQLYTTSDANLSVGRNFTVNSKIHDTGRWNDVNLGGTPLESFGPNSYLSHNEIYNYDFDGMILYSSINGIAEYNNVHDVMRWGNDGGGIHIGGNLMDWGNIVKYNYVHNIYGIYGNTSADGIYVDDSTPGSTVYGNVLNSIAPNRYLASRIGGTFMIGGGRDTFLQNNIVFNSGVGIYLDQWAFGGNAAKLATIATSTYVPPRSTYFPQGTLVATTSTLIPEGTVISNNIVYNTTPTYQYNSWDPYLAISNNLTSIDPLFVDSANNNFNLQGGSPAYALGFQDIPFNQIGLINPNDSVFQDVTYAGTDTIPDAPTGVSAAAGNHQATITFTAGSNGGSTILYYLASSTPGNLTATSSGGPITVTGLTNGTTYTFQVYAVNAIGTSTPSSSSVGVTLDGTAPATVAHLPGGTYGIAQSVTLTCTDNIGGVGCDKTYYSVDGTAPTIQYSGAISVSSNTTLKFYSTDLNGNSESSDTEVYVIDSTYPFTTITPSNVSATTSTSVSFLFSANKTGSTYECKIDSASFTSCSSPQSLSGLAEGSHTFTVRATDTLSHIEPSPAFVTWLVDTTAPSVSITSPSNSDTVSGSVTISASNSDAGSGISSVQFLLDNAPIGSSGTANPYSITWDTTSATNASHTLDAVARDVAGNYATSSITVTVDNTIHTYTVGGSISGLSGTIVLQNNSGDDLTLSSNGSFAFVTGIASGNPYSVTVLTQPSGQTCIVSTGSGTMPSSNVTNVSVTCTDNPITPTPTPTPTQSVTTSYSSGGGGSASSQVNNLIAMGNYTLAQQIAKQFGLTIPALTLPVNAPTSNSGSLFNRTLRVGTTNSDVKKLQVFLNAQGFTVAKKGAGSPGHETTYFGPATKAALMKFQLAHKKETLDPQGLKAPTGFFGMDTMKAVNKLMR